MSMQTRPDFVVVGASDPDGGVILLASKDLHQAELKAVADLERDWGNEGRRIRIRHTYMLTTEMGSVTVVRAPDYSTAWRTLFQTWTPPEPRQAALPGSRALPPPPPKAIR